MKPPSRLRNRLMILLIAMISIVPFALAWLFARHPEWGGTPGNYGYLVSPAVPIPYASLLPDPVGPEAGSVKGRWILLQVADEGHCASGCRKSLAMTRQVRLLLNKDIPRVRRLLLGLATGSGELQAGDDDLLLSALTPTVLPVLSGALGKPLEPGTVLLLDPFANLMMWYPPDFDPYGVLKDLKHLLRHSQIG